MADNKKHEEESELDGLRKRPSLNQVAEELKQLGGIALPVTAMNCVVFARAMVSVLCLGRLGSLQLAGGALSLGFTNITGYSVLFGLASGMDPVCSQAFGSKNWPLLGLSLQCTMLILLSACIPISVLWLNLGRIMVYLGQDGAVTAVASTYCLYSLPDLAVNSLLQPLRVFMRSQGYTTPMMLCSFLAVAIHIPLNVVLVFVLKLGVPGVALSTVLTNFNMVLFMLGYIRVWGACGKTWTGWSSACLAHWRPLLSLALPSCFGICLEWWWYEILVVVAGYLPQPQVAIGTAAILMQTTSLMYTFPLALSASASTRVGNELGANAPARARLAAHVALGCALFVAITSATSASLLRDYWARLFSDDPDIVTLTAAAMPIIGLCELGNCPQTTGCGVLRGSARPTIGAHINLGSFYFVGTPVALALAFRTKLGFTGLWFGLLVAQAVCATAILAVVLRTDWHFEATRAKQLTAPPPNGALELTPIGDEEETSLLVPKTNSSC